MTGPLTYTLKEIATIIEGTRFNNNADQPVEQLLTDSRKVLFPNTSVFFALDGPRRKGSDFIGDLYDRGLRAFVIGEDHFETEKFPAAGFIRVSNVLKALQKLVEHHRKKFDIPVIGITGSNGKTIVKEWLFQLLHADYRIVRSPKSFNSQIGVPLSVWEMNPLHQLGIFEAGISQPGEMEMLEKIIEPGIGVFTNLGDAHNEGFADEHEKCREKLLLFIHAESILYCSDYPVLDEEVEGFLKNINYGIQCFTWSRHKPATLFVTEAKKQAGHTVIEFEYANQHHILHIPFLDDASVENAITCTCLMLGLNYTVEEIAKRLKLLVPVEMRLQLRQGINNCSVIDDSYSADFHSLSIALDFLLQQNAHKKHTVILSDILQSGKDEHELYRQLADMLREKSIDRLIAVGPVISANQEAFAAIPEKNFFASSADLKSHFSSLHFQNEAILLKGARIFKFEEFSKRLQQKTHQTLLEIDLGAMSHNLKEYHSLLSPEVKLMVMVKASGYGNGSFEIAGLLQFHKVDYLAVAYADEGVELRKAGITLPIMVMNPEESTFESLTHYDLEPELFTFSILDDFANYLASAAIPHYPVHIKLDTGMHRLGFEPSDVETLNKKLLEYPELKIQSVFSHLAASDEPSAKDFTNRQAAIFLECCEKIRSATGYSFLKHIANSSAISYDRSLHLDMVRLGIGLYGADANPVMQQKLRNVTTLKTTVAQVKKVKTGETVGYGRKAKVERDSIIATVRIGYADGYPRFLSHGKGHMVVRDRVVPVIGNVCMDMTILDVTDVPGVSEGDEVIVFGEKLPISQVATAAATIPYEMMTGVSERVKRVYFE